MNIISTVRAGLPGSAGSPVIAAGWLLLAVVFFASYRSTLRELYTFWMEGYSWRFFIPAIFLYIVWRQRAQLAATPVRPSLRLGSLVMAASGFLLMVGEFTGTHALRELSIAATFYGLVLLTGGPAMLRQLFWPLAYLALMTSLTDRALAKLAFPLQLISATAASAFLNAIGHDVVRNQHLLRLPNTVVEVGESCSGLNQLVSIAALAMPLAYLTLRKWLNRIILVALSIFLGLAANWARVILIVLWHYDMARQAVHGPNEILGVPFIFLAALAIVCLIASLMLRSEKREPLPARSAVAAARQERPSARIGWALAIAVVIMSATAAVLYGWQCRPVALATGPEGFPQTIGEWRGTVLPTLGDPFVSGLADVEVIRRYVDSAGGSLGLYVGYFAMQNQEKELVDYRYDWLHRKAEIWPGNAPMTSGLRVKRRPVSGFPGGAANAYFWYHINGRDLVDPRQAKIATLKDCFLRRRTNGAIVIVLIPAFLDQEGAGARSFLEKAYPSILSFLGE